MERRTCCALVLRIAVAVVSACLSVCMSSAQELPKLKELSEREMMEHLVPGVRKGKWGYMNDKENFRIKPVFNAADEYKWTVVDGKDSVATAKVLFEGKYALLNRQGTFLFHPLFDSISDFDRGVALFVKDGKAGILTADGRILTDGLDEIRPFDANGLAWFMKDGKWGIYDLQGNLVFVNEFDSFPESTYGDLTLVSKDGLMGFLSLAERKAILEPCADSVAFDANEADVIIYRTSAGLGCMDVSGRKILPAEYEEIVGMGDGRLMVKMLGRYGLWEKSGKMLLPSCLYTNQIADDHAFYQVMEEKAGLQMLRVHYKGKLMDLNQFDDVMFQELSQARYNERIDEAYERFPYWFKGHFHETIDADELAGQWRFEETFYPFRAVARKFDSSFGIAQDNESFLNVGKDMKVKDSKGFDFSSGTTLNKASIVIDGEIIPCGSWLTPLFRSVNSGKIAAYDKVMGTRLFYDWKSISAKIRNKGIAPDGDAVVIIDMMIDELLVQRVISKFSTVGTLRFSIKMDGIIYNQQDYINSSEARCFLTEDMLIVSVSYGKNSVPKTCFYRMDGTLITQLDALHADMLLEGGQVVRLFGRDRDLYTICKVDMAARSYSKNSVGMAIDNTIVRPIGDHLYFYDRQSRLLKSILDIGSEYSPVNALRYTDATWDGQRVIGVSANYWNEISRAKWTVVPRVRKGTFSENIDGQLFTIESVSEDGMAIYSMCPDIWTREGTRYGFISYEEDFFTQALFDEVKPFTDGYAEVKIRGRWSRISKEDFKKYLNSPSEANSADNYDVGAQIFTVDQMKKAGSSKATEIVTSEGFRMERSRGGKLVAFENTYTGKYGFADSTGVMVVPPLYDDYHSCDFSLDGMVAVRRDTGLGDEDSGWGFLDMSGALVIPCIYHKFWNDDLERFFSPGENGISPMCRILSGGSRRMGCINRKGEVVIPFEYDDISKPVDGVLTAKLGIMTMKLKEDGTML